MTDLTVTAILPFHNSPYITEAIKSVADQTRPPDNVILVSDNASTETNDRALQTIERTPLDWTFIPRESDSGDFPTPTNQATNHTDSDLYAFLFHDDRWLPTYLETQLSEFEDHPPGVGLQWTGEYHINQHGERTGTTNIVSWPQTERWQLFLSCWVPSPSACVVRATHFHSIGGFDPELLPLADWDFYLRMWQACALRSIDTPLVEFRKHDGQHATEGWDTVNEYRGKFIEKHRGLLERAGFYGQARDRHVHLCGLDVPPWSEE